MIEAQAHAIALMKEVYPLPPIPELATIPTFELTKEEQALSDEEKEAAARVLLWGSEYGAEKQNVSQKINGCVEVLRTNFATTAGNTGQHLDFLKKLLWLVTLSNIVILSSTFCMLYLQLVAPLDSFVKLIAADKPLNDENSLKEIHLLATAYNDLLRRRDGLDDILRSAAKTDSLTNLPNRYGYEQYLLGLGESGYSLAIFLFDVNFLKQMNDKRGHAAGDELLKAAAECIAQCFGVRGEENCFRFGGDEFSAIIKDASLTDIEERIVEFQKEQHKRNISISWGYAFSEDVGATTFKAMMDEADQRMYACKKQMHEELGLDK